MSVEVHPLSNNPTEAWEILSLEQNVIQINLSLSSQSPSPNEARIVCMSDTHARAISIETVPNGDIFIHAGDFTTFGMEDEVMSFNDWLGKLPHRHKIVIAGNHELSFDPTNGLGYPRRFRDDEVPETNMRDRLTNCIYLEDEMVEIHGLKIYGSPWQPEYRGWAFNVQRGEDCLRKWDMIPDHVDILVTHGPPIGHGDLCLSGVRAGCVELLSVVQKRVKPKYHVFGHIHEGYGVTTDGLITFINASTCNVSYQPVNPPIAFDMILPEGHFIHR
uniref:Metallophosphoesterase domain-containing protein 1 n=1 Tax=Lygus hesperus TaxID=30085 RepID=A0A0A9WR64_LYGHE